MVSKRTGLLAATLITVLAVTGALPTLKGDREDSLSLRPASAWAAASGPADAQGLTVAQDKRGWLWAAWEAEAGSDVDLYFSRWNGQAWSVPQPVQRRPDAWDRSPSLVIAADGTPWLAWSSAARTDPGHKGVLISRWVGQRWTTPEVVPLGSIGRATEPALAAAPDGTLWLALVGFDGTDDEIYASHWDGQAWSLPQQVNADDGDPTLYDRQPRLAVGQDKRPWLVWTDHQEGADDEIYASHWVGTGWTPEQRISQDDNALDVWPALALDAQGQPWVAWQGRVTDGQRSHLRILVSRWDSTRSTWTSESIASSPLAAEVEERQPALSLGSTGEMHLAWTADRSHDAGSALAYARRKDGRWTEPRLVRAGVSSDAVALATGGNEALRLLWLAPSADAPSPVTSASITETAELLSTWIDKQVAAHRVEGVDPIPNRYLAFGDSITYGIYSGNPYPAQLEAKLDIRVADSEVINSGNPGEATYGGSERITGEVSDHLPHYVLIMEGTNDVTRDKPPAEVYDHLQVMIRNARVTAGVNNVHVMLATILPRLDDRNDETATMNQQAIIPIANDSYVPLCDQWQAFYAFGPWQYLYEDDVHPNASGLQLMAETFYDCLIATYPDVKEETLPPTTWIESVPPLVECGQAIAVSWNGIDNLNWVVDYDVQVQVMGGEWADWLLATKKTSGLYTGTGSYGLYGFRVRGRDLLGNQSGYSDPAFTQIADSVPPYEAHVNPLPPAQIAPFPVSWGGSATCAGIVAYDVQTRAGVAGSWQGWMTGTVSTSGSFAPSLPQYGDTYSFRARAKDEAGNWSDWSDPSAASTKLARFSVAGHSYNVRHQPVVGAVVDLNPASLWTTSRPGGAFLAHVATDGNYAVSAERGDAFGPLPPMQVAVNDHVDGLEFILPPQNDAVANGGFEAGTLATWELAGTAVPTLTHTTHTGLGAVQLGGEGGDSHLSQVITPGLPLSDPTLSFLARLEEAGPTSTLRIELAGAGGLFSLFTDTLVMADGQWTHAWYDLSGLVAQPLTLTFVVSNSPAILLDEVSLGSSLPGSYSVYLPCAYRKSP